MGIFGKLCPSGAIVVGAFIACLALPTAAQATKVLDCPMRDAPFSADSPLIDLLLSEPAKTSINKYIPGLLAQSPPFITGTKAPTFSSILTLRKLLEIIPPAEKPDLDALEKSLNALPVSGTDKIARCARYDDDRPKLTLTKGRPRVLLFEKMTGFRDDPSVLAANAAFRMLAERHGWALVTTEMAGAMHPSILKQFDVVIWNNVSGDVLTLTQRKAFRSFIENGGGYVGVHGSAGDPVYFWDWYPDTLIGARFIGHPNNPQFHDARIVIEKSVSGIGGDLAPGWTMNDEWYSFAKSARLNGADIVATLDESSYSPGINQFGGAPLAMGADHPIAWTRCVSKGRAFYSAIGHRPETYSDAHYLKLLEQAVVWAARPSGSGCSGKVAH